MMSCFKRNKSADPVEFSNEVAGNAPGRNYSALERSNDFKRVLRQTPEARRVLAQILVRCQLWERSYVAGDPHETARREGMRDIGLWIMEIVNDEPGDEPHTAETEDGDGPGSRAR